MATLAGFLDSGLPAQGTAARVRAARIRDWARLQNLVRSVFPDVDEATFGHWLRDERHCLAVALTSAGLVGMIRIEVQPGERQTQLSLLGVVPEARGQGVARALLTYSEEVACACGAPDLVYGVASDDVSCRAFLRHVGFTQGQGTGTGAEDVCNLVRRARSPWPTWQLKREHAPRVRPDAFQRLAMRALYGAWLGAGLGRTS